MIDKATVDRILDATDIVDVISDFVTLRRRGANYIACCPFHNEKTPSFSVSRAKGICHCFSCGKGGSPVNFIMEHEQMTYVEALRYLAKRYNIKGADALIEKAVGVVSRYEDYARQAGVDGYWLQKIKEETGCRIENMSETVRRKGQ